MKIINTFSFTNNKILNICYYLILFFPLALIVGPLLGEIFLLLLILITFTFRDFRKNFFEIVKNNLVLKMILLFSIYIFFLSLLSYDNFDILKTGIFYFCYALFSLAIYYIVLKKSDVLKNFFIFYFFLILVILIDSFIQHYFGQNILGYQKFGSRIVSFFENIFNCV